MRNGSSNGDQSKLRICKRRSYMPIVARVTREQV
jgi:hypothetical protein